MEHIGIQLAALGPHWLSLVLTSAIGAVLVLRDHKKAVAVQPARVGVRG
ncbi:MAG TPA: hypothetical protein VK009_27880 [Chloroflexota bacterium]|nr:hypothetical protein [Chloroflexota bacterium]